MRKISETADYRVLITFFIENELEFEEGEEYGDDEIVKCWRADAYGEDCGAAAGHEENCGVAAGSDGAISHETEDVGRLAGACILAMREGEYICDGIAVAQGLRKTGLGRELLGLLLKEAAGRGADRIFLVARAPGFFAKAGFVPISRADAPEFFECFTCPQYGKTCHPEVMRLDLA
ncbi:MAG: GNAT family N-acetyltransferase [Clostridiales Family XIII bacterium]|jgi:GNAT superfamily N-acetyltransferase|nr:GNAT family N-acetyltransferase [Clostridiales Family XIII bacterium]